MSTKFLPSVSAQTLAQQFFSSNGECHHPEHASVIITPADNSSARSYLAGFNTGEKHDNSAEFQRDHINDEVIDLARCKCSNTTPNQECKLRAQINNAEEQKMNTNFLHKVTLLHRKLGGINVKGTKETVNYDRIKLIVEKFRSDNNVQSKLITKNEEEKEIMVSNQKYEELINLKNIVSKHCDNLHNGFVKVNYQIVAVKHTIDIQNNNIGIISGYQQT
uniref:Uncharacterized protein n=1 Tax=Glossina pallidipes TaxID=7398 RepID=A0A1B0ACG0_GLOPL